MGQLRHRYFVCPRGEQRAIPWDPFAPQLDVDMDVSLEYFGRALQVVEQRVGGRPLTFYLVWEHLDWLPSYGDDVVVLVLGDERHRCPTYADRVGAIFKCFGIRPELECRLWGRPTALKVAIVEQYLRNWVDGAPRYLRYRWQRVRSHLGGPAVAPIYDLPLGYYKQVELPVTPILERTDDVHFAGSITNRIGRRRTNSVMRWLRSPKEVSRQQMLVELMRIKARRTDLRLNLGTIAEFVEARTADGASYSEQLMNAKICMVPRGTTPETFRFYEALRAGCVLITERLPKRWFYDGCPAVQIEGWHGIEQVLDELLSDEARLLRLHEASLAWWVRTCSGAALGGYVTSTLHELRGEVAMDDSTRLSLAIEPLRGSQAALRTAG